MERDTDTTVVFILLRDSQVLLEKRPPSSSLPGTHLYPGGSAKENEFTDLEIALRREVTEELGIFPIEVSPIPLETDIYGETGRLLKPYLISRWEGIIPEMILDKGNPIFWEDIETVANHQLISMRRLTTALKDFLTTRT